MVDPAAPERIERESFLARVRRSLHPSGAPVFQHAPPGAASAAPAATAEPVPTRAELVARFAQEARAADTTVTRVTSLAELRQHLGTLVSSRSCTTLVRADTPLLRELEPDATLHRQGVSVFVAAPAALESREGLRTVTERASIGVTEADWAIADTGTLALLHRPGQGRAVSLLPPIHIAILPVARIVPDLNALLERLDAAALPSALTLISGPSRTADIEMVITRGVHGPGELHVILLDA